MVFGVFTLVPSKLSYHKCMFTENMPKQILTQHQKRHLIVYFYASYYGLHFMVPYNNTNDFVNSVNIRNYLKLILLMF